MSRSLSDINPENCANFMFDENKSVDNRLRELPKTRFGTQYEDTFEKINWTPSLDIIRFQDTLTEIKANAHRTGWELIKISWPMTSHWQQQNH